MEVLLDNKPSSSSIPFTRLKRTANSLANFSSAISDSEEDGELSVLGELRHLEKHLGKRLKELEVSLSEGFGGVALGTLPLPALFRCLNMMEARCSNCDNS